MMSVLKRNIGKLILNTHVYFTCCIRIVIYISGRANLKASIKKK